MRDETCFAESPADEPTRVLIRPIPATHDPLWGLGREISEMVLAYLYDEPIAGGRL